MSLFSQYKVDDRVTSDWFGICPIRPIERVTERTTKVLSFLKDLLNECRKRQELEDDPEIILVDNRRNADSKPLSEVLNKGSLEYKTVVLPDEIGGLGENGELNWRTRKPDNDIDVADQLSGDSKRKRIFPGDPSPSGWKERGSVTLRDAGEGLENDEKEIRLRLVMPGRDVAIDDHEQAKFDMTLADHKSAIVSSVTEIGKKVGLKAAIVDALAVASEWHDRGKNRDYRQRYARKQDEDEPYAKFAGRSDWRILAGYRHELGSLLDAMRDEAVMKHPERDLILHLIASHHGNARPHFGSLSFDNERYTTRENTEAVNEAMQRFGRLQKRYGRWGLAWLEALMRCADIAASQPPDGFKEPQVEEEPCKHDIQMSLL